MLNKVVRTGLDLLKQERNYRSIDILRKFETLDIGISASSLSKVIRLIGLLVVLC